MEARLLFYGLASILCGICAVLAGSQFIILGGIRFDPPRLLSTTELRAIAGEPLVIRVSDLNEATAWYKEKLGFKQVVELPDEGSDQQSSRVVLLHGNARIDLLQRGSVVDIARVRASLAVSAPEHRPALRVDDVDAVTESLKASGVVVVGMPRFTTRRAGLRVSEIRDLEGRTLELQQRL